jgi:hypothetical protein
MSNAVRFEDLSHVYTSNDGQIGVEKVEGDEWVVYLTNGRDTSNQLLITKSRDVAEAFLLGWDARS